jgi:hypothetical protein
MALKYILYVDGQLGLNFDTQEDAEQAAKAFQSEGFDTLITREERP